MKGPGNSTLTRVGAWCLAAKSSATDVVTAAMAKDTITVKALAEGTATITVTATDPDDESAMQTAAVTVLRVKPGARGQAGAPEPDAQSGDERHAASRKPLLSNHFTDPDGDALTYEAVSSDEDIVELELDDGELEMYGVDVGVATVTITATDPGGLTATMSFTATIVEG